MQRTGLAPRTGQGKIGRCCRAGGRDERASLRGAGIASPSVPDERTVSEEDHQRSDHRGDRGPAGHGRGAPRPDHRATRPGVHRPRRRARPGQGRAGLRRRQRARTAARRLRRRRHARRRRARRGVHLAHPGPGAGCHEGRRRRRRRAAHREELHRRRAQLRDRGRTGRRRGHPGHAPWSSTTTSPSRTRPGRRAGAASAAPCWWRRSPARRPPAATTWTRWPAIAERVNANVRSMGMALTPCTVPHSGEPSFTLADDEMEIGHRHPRRAGPGAREAGQRGRDRRDPARLRRRGPAVQLRRQHAAVRQRHGRHAADRAVPRLPLGATSTWRTRGSRSPAPWSATTSPPWRCRACRSPCSSSTTS